MAPATPFRIFAAVTAVVAAGALVAIQVTRSDGPRARAGPAGPGPVTPPTPTVSPSPTDRQPTAVPAPPPPGRVIFEDDFSKPDGGLLGGASSDSGETQYGDRFAEYTGDGALLVRATSDVRDFVGGANTGDVTVDGRVLDDLAGVSVEVKATPVDIGPGAAWGITCRRDFTVGSFYFGSVSLEGNRRRAAIIRQDVAGGGWTELASARLPASIPLQEGVHNRLRLDCIGPAISLSIDGQLLAEATDDSFASGAVTLGANPLPQDNEVATAEVEFDDFVLREVT